MVNPYRKVAYILKVVGFVLFAVIGTVAFAGALFVIPFLELGWPGLFIAPGELVLFAGLALLLYRVEKWWKRKEREYDERASRR